MSKVAVYQGRYIVGRTHATLLLVRARRGCSQAAQHAGPGGPLCRLRLLPCPSSQTLVRACPFPFCWQGDLETCRLSEVAWEGGNGGERFYFESEQVRAGSVRTDPCTCKPLH